MSAADEKHAPAAEAKETAKMAAEDKKTPPAKKEQKKPMVFGPCAPCAAGEEDKKKILKKFEADKVYYKAHPRPQANVPVMKSAAKRSELHITAGNAGKPAKADEATHAKHIKPAEEDDPTGIGAILLKEVREARDLARIAQKKVQELKTGQKAPKSEDEDSDKENEDPKEVPKKKKVQPATAYLPKRKQCTYVGARGIDCAHFTNNPDAFGRCCHHRGSICFRECAVPDCANWTRNSGNICTQCKMRLSSATKREVRAKKMAEGVEYVNALPVLDDEMRATILDLFGAPKPAEDDELSQ